ncbi:MAG: hypothetical protein MUE85_16630 [Microscillaceae bacterium]|nr:hypothetical protein [Microscillaceae bacterium]
MDEIDLNLRQLMNQDDWTNLRLAGQLVQGLGYPLSHLERLVLRVTQMYLQDYMPSASYHRFGCSLLDRMTYHLIFNKLNEFLNIPYLEVEVCSDYVHLRPWVICQAPETVQTIEVFLEDYTNTLFYSIRSEFSIGIKPQ